MPIIKSAIKKLRQGAKKRERNLAAKGSLKNLLDSFKKKPVPTTFSKLASALDKAAKNNLMHKNKASRLKSRLAKRLNGSALQSSPDGHRAAGLKAARLKSKTPKKKTK